MGDREPLKRSLRPGAGGPSSSRRPPSTGARAQGRRPPPRKTQTPLWMWLVLIVLPAALIGGLFLFKGKSGEEKHAEKPKVVDPNLRIRELEAEVGKLQEEFKVYLELSRAENPAAKEKKELLITHIDRWMADWDGIIDPLKGEDGRLPEAMRGFQATRSRVNTLRSDILKTTGFE